MCETSPAAHVDNPQKDNPQCNWGVRPEQILILISRGEFPSDKGKSHNLFDLRYLVCVDSFRFTIPIISLSLYIYIYTHTYNYK